MFNEPTLLEDATIDDVQGHLRHTATEELISEYLTAWGQRYGWECDKENVMRKLCEEYLYNPNDNEVVWKAVGFFWGLTGWEAQATAAAILLRKRLNETYKVVAKENNWDISEYAI